MKPARSPSHKTTPPFLDDLAMLLLVRYPDGSERFVGLLPGAESYGDPPEVVVERTEKEVRIHRFEVAWDGPHTPLVEPVLLGVVRWPELAPDVALAVFRLLIDEASRQRRERFRTCRYCRAMHGPEHMQTDDVCHGCAERYLGVVH
jgi:hypothetical protein